MPGSAGPGAAGAGALAPAGAAVPLRRIDCDVAARPDIRESANESVRKIPPVHQVARVKSVAAWRLPKSVSEPAPAAPIAARPPPFPAWRRTTTIKRTASSRRRDSKK